MGRGLWPTKRESGEDAVVGRRCGPNNYKLACIKSGSMAEAGHGFWFAFNGDNRNVLLAGFHRDTFARAHPLHILLIQ